MPEDTRTKRESSCRIWLFTVDKQWEGRVREALMDRFTITTFEREAELYQRLQAGKGQPCGFDLIAIDLSSLQTEIGQAVSRLLELQPDAKIAVFSPAPSFSQVVSALKAGGLDFYAQTLSTTELRRIFDGLCLSESGELPHRND